MVGDGASYNLKLFKSLAGAPKGAFGVGQVNVEHDDDFSVPCSFKNPFDPKLDVALIICPSHQMKNQINALFNSSPRRSKLLRFHPDDPMYFGWISIVQMYSREQSRKKRGSTGVIPFLRKDFIVRDPWTKLNVQPAKIMQSDNVIAELSAYSAECRGSGHPDLGCERVVEYLSALRLIFGRGFIGKELITSSNCPVMQNLTDGFEYFKAWFRNWEGHPGFTPLSPREKRFLSYITFDLLRLCIYGMRKLAETFFALCPERCIVPMFVSGSPVESIFSQVRTYNTIFYPVNVMSDRRGTIMVSPFQLFATKMYQNTVFSKI
ncbi:MAG: hypothetical protein GY696_22915, partial [Gammaproteobacteria bacterium]|nr:hypothetical protein [Gammaproteobacteria bacterium]